MTASHHGLPPHRRVVVQAETLHAIRSVPEKDYKEDDGVMNCMQTLTVTLVFSAAGRDSFAEVVLAEARGRGASVAVRFLFPRS